MKKFIFSVAVLITVFALTDSARAQGMMGGGNIQSINTDQTAQEEAQGKTIWENIQAKETTCANLSDEDFDLLGEYFMGQMMGNSHAFMNIMMEQQLGQQGESQMHIVMGKRLSGCDVAAAYPVGGIGFMPMMQMMWGGWANGGYSGMMNFGYGPGLSGWIFMLISVVWLIAGILAIVWFWKKLR